MLGVTLGSQYVGTQGMFLHCWRICVVRLALELIGSWVVVGFSVGMEAFGRSLITYYSYYYFHVVRSFLVFSGLGLKPPASEFQSYYSISLKTSLSIQHG